MSLAHYLTESAHILAKTAEAVPEARFDHAVQLCATALGAGLPVLVCGNGGSASDAEHLTAELVGRFLRTRPGLPAISLVSGAATLTALGNDFGYETVFSRQVEALGRPGAVLIGLSTSGNSANVVRAFEVAREKGLGTIAFTGEGGGKLAALADVLLAVPSRHTPLIQQAHIVLYHHLCAKLDEVFAP